MGLWGSPQTFSLSHLFSFLACHKYTGRLDLCSQEKNYVLWGVKEALWLPLDTPLLEEGRLWRIF